MSTQRHGIPLSLLQHVIARLPPIDETLRRYGTVYKVAIPKEYPAVVGSFLSAAGSPREGVHVTIDIAVFETRRICEDYVED